MDYKELMNRKVDTINHAGVKGMKWGKRNKKTKLDVRVTGTTSTKTIMKRLGQDNKSAFSPTSHKKNTSEKADAEIEKATGKSLKSIKKRSIKKARRYISSYHDVEISVKGSGKWKQTKNPYDK